MLWMISYRFRFAHKAEEGFTYSEPQDAILLRKMHPAVFVAKMLEGMRDLENEPYRPGQLQMREEMLTFYSAVEVPEGTLTEDQADAFPM